MKNKNIYFKNFWCAITLSIIASSTIIAQEKHTLNDVNIISYSNTTKLPNFLKFNNQANIELSQLNDWVKQAFQLNASVNLKIYNSEKDNIGFTHIRFKQFINQYPVDGTMMIAHVKNGKLISVNGDFYKDINANQSASISEEVALSSAIKNVNAKKYKWQNVAETERMKIATKNPKFSYLPKGELVYVHKSGADYSSESIRLSYKFNIYAEEPLSRDYVYVDVQTGDVIAKEEIINTADVVGTAATMYSGNVSITCDDMNNGTYRLRETGRGNGIETYNLNNTSPNYSVPYTNYTEFTNNSTSWNLSGPDQAATDAHWGAEKTFDYYSLTHSRNSIDNNGFALLSFVHYGNNFNNAFWNGDCMTYGDGDNSQFTILTALDVCGHEITHGLNSFTAQMTGGSSIPKAEGGALNEAWADIMGTTIENYARPTQWDWKMGADITPSGNGIRNMSNPNLLGDPDTYQGTYWNAQGQVHQNAGPAIYWYYLLCQGGSGTNDNGDSYAINGIGMTKAQLIAYKALVSYATPGTDYANMRICCIQAATDIYGSCSSEVEETTNAWYAVGVGPISAGGGSPTAAFNANITNSCSLPATINFTNSSTNASNALWYFGDGTTSSQLNPSHTYTSAGSFTVKLVASGGCGADSLTTVSYIVIAPPSAPTTADATGCAPSPVLLNASGGNTLHWYTSASGGTPVNTGTSYTTPILSTTTTYYVESSIGGATGNVGPIDNTFSSSLNYFNSAERSLIFDVLQPCTLVSVNVYANASGNRTINLRDSNDNIIQTWTINIPSSGLNVVTLNASLTTGTGFKLGGALMNLMRNSSSSPLPYPYTYTNFVDITGSSIGAQYYYFFYDWVIQESSCSSSRIPVTANINVCTGIDNADAQNNMLLYPNPSKGNVTFETTFSQEENIQIKIINTLGQLVFIKEQKVQSGSTKTNLDLTNLAKGIYYFQTQTTSGVITRKIEIN